MRNKTVLSRYHRFCWVKIPTQNSSTAAAPTRPGCELSTTWLWKIQHTYLHTFRNLQSKSCSDSRIADIIHNVKTLHSSQPTHLFDKIPPFFFQTIVKSNFLWWLNNAIHLYNKLVVADLNDAVQMSDNVSVGGSCEQWCNPVSDLLCHTLRTHAVVLQKQLDTTYKPARNRHTTLWVSIM